MSIMPTAARRCFREERYIKIGPDPRLWSALSGNFSGILTPGGGDAMKRKRYSDEQIAFALRQAENGTLVEEVCRKLGCV
jgi:hypothetical protein